MATLNASSQSKLKNVHPALVAVVKEAVRSYEGPMEILITCGVRSLAEQRRLVNAGASKTMRSRHLPHGPKGYSHAIDVAFKINNKVRWDWPPFTEFSKYMKAAAKKLRTPIEWGGDWRSFKDGPHYQLPWKDYP